MGRRKNNRKPLTDVNEQQETFEVRPSKKKNNSKNVSEELLTPHSQTAPTQTKSDYSQINSSSGKENVQKMSKKKNKQVPIEANNIIGNEMILYDELYAQKQKNIYLGICCVCRTEQYSLNCCSQCEQLKYCSPKCRRQHRTNFWQKLICGRAKAFAKARSRLKQEDKDTLLASGIIEISQYLHSVPRPEVYEMLNGPVRAVILEIRQVDCDVFGLNIHVQDFSGQTTQIKYPCFGLSIFGNQHLLINGYLDLLIPGEFILLVDGHWNYDTDPESAAIVINDLQHIRLIN